MEHDLESQFLPGTVAPPAYGAHAEQVLKATLHRRRRTRGRAVEDGMALHDEKLDNITAALLAFFNGEWTKSCAQHFCRCDPMCTDIILLAVRGTKVYNEAFLSPLYSCGQPAASRWHTYEPSLTLITAAKCCHRILPRAYAIAFRPEVGARLIFR